MEAPQNINKLFQKKAAPNFTLNQKPFPKKT